MWGRFGILILALLSGCSKEPKFQLQKLEGNAQGTTYHISYWSPQPVDNQAIDAEVLQVFDSIDKTLSNYRPDSVIEKLKELV